MNQPQHSPSCSSNSIFILVFLLWLSSDGLCVCYSASNISQNSKAFKRKVRWIMINTRKINEIFFVSFCEIFVYFFLLSIPQQGENWRISCTQSDTKFLCSVCNSLKESRINMSHVDMNCDKMLETVIILCRHICISRHRTQFIALQNSFWWC